MKSRYQRNVLSGTVKRVNQTSNTQLNSNVLEINESFNKAILTSIFVGGVSNYCTKK